MAISTLWNLLQYLEFDDLVAFTLEVVDERLLSFRLLFTDFPERRHFITKCLELFHPNPWTYRSTLRVCYHRHRKVHHGRTWSVHQTCVVEGAQQLVQNECCGTLWDSACRRCIPQIIGIVHSIIYWIWGWWETIFSNVKNGNVQGYSGCGGGRGADWLLIQVAVFGIDRPIKLKMSLHGLADKEELVISFLAKVFLSFITTSFEL